MILALDVGTSSARAALYDDAARPVPGRFHQVHYRPAVTPDGGVEHDPATLLDAAAACVDAVVAHGGLPDVAGVAIATFWHGLLGMDGSGRACTPLFTWADTRAAGDAGLLREALDEEALRRRTGCHLHASYWPAKLRWLARERPHLVARVARWGSFGEYLELALFGEAATSVSMASGTGLLDQQTMRWDGEALAAAELDAAHLFPLRDRRDGRVGLRPAWARRWPALRGRPWFPAVGDGAAGNVGSGCVTSARLALNVGTSIALRMAAPDLGTPPRGLWRYRLDRGLSLVGGALSEGGNVYAWCRELLRLPDDAALEAALAVREPDAHGLTVLPFVAGERSPGWRGDRRAVIAGLKLDTGPLDVLAAALEAVALRIALVYDLLRPLAAPRHVIVASGGAVARAGAWAQTIADALGQPLIVCREEEATSRGAAVLALEALGRVPDLGAAVPPAGDTIEPVPAHHARYRAALERQRRLDTRLG
ncbi:MAG TPA: FGGY family carbohydrate kinase [Methylomirabilota bacterium]|nr:FGGY family carbohydrate kinase [Methylomirabilota bacterium]